MKDSRNFTILAFAAYRNQTNCFKILFHYALKYFFGDTKQQELKNWVNTRTDDSFTALHFAVKWANHCIIDMLVEEAGADLDIKNKFGSSVMHIAAQQDQPLSLYYFYNKGLDINMRDDKMGTPLHWAVFTRSELALNYILSMKPNIEA